MHMIEEVFGTGCDLYSDVLQCARDSDKAALRKAYYRQALKVHPDKVPNDKNAAAKFQAITSAYQLLQNQECRKLYDESGILPSVDELDEENMDGTAQWRDYFSQIFGKVTTGGIEAFSAKYKCSDEERRDVLKEFKARKGNMEKMLDYVMLSEARDAARWVEDYIRPAMEKGEVDSTYSDTMERTLKKLQDKVLKEDANDNNSDDEIDRDDDETESENEDKSSLASRRVRRIQQETVNRKPSLAKKTKKSVKRTKKKGDNDMTDLVAQIQNRRSNAFATLGARYGVNMDDEDPLTDKQFETINSKLRKKNK